jgi:hypothetical protein
VSSCPNCGFRNRPARREFVRQVKAHFGDLPVWEMMSRRWIAPTTDIAALGDELMRFFRVRSAEELHELLASSQLPTSGGRRMLACNLAPMPRYKYDPKQVRPNG